MSWRFRLRLMELRQFDFWFFFDIWQNKYKNVAYLCIFYVLTNVYWFVSYRILSHRSCLISIIHAMWQHLPLYVLYSYIFYYTIVFFLYFFVFICIYVYIGDMFGIGFYCNRHIWLTSCYTLVVFHVLFVRPVILGNCYNRIGINGG